MAFLTGNCGELARFIPPQEGLALASFTMHDGGPQPRGWRA
ncbi:hypothetical protein ART_1685 [Arthrobacter sp. PAMC 25486]|nr:hypothetical protein ART_1685 [Arthrobacter sp. PAMC 25486]